MDLASLKNGNFKKSLINNHKQLHLAKVFGVSMRTISRLKSRLKKQKNFTRLLENQIKSNEQEKQDIEDILNVNKLTRIENFKIFIIILLLTEKLGGLLNKKIQIFLRISIV